jgi:hypothetical protein
MTDGILLAETQGDRLLEQYDTIIIDEAHERSLNIDFLLGYLRQLLPAPGPQGHHHLRDDRPRAIQPPLRPRARPHRSSASPGARTPSKCAIARSMRSPKARSPRKRDQERAYC